MPDLLTLDPHRRRFGAEMAVGVDLHFDAAIAEDALGHDRDGVDVLVLGRDDEGRGLVVGIGRAGTDAGEESARGIEHLPVPIAPCELHHPPAIRHRPLHQHDWVGAHKLALDIRVTAARAGTPGPDAAEYRTGIAAHDPIALGRAELLGAGGEHGSAHLEPSRARNASQRR